MWILFFLFALVFGVSLVQSLAWGYVFLPWVYVFCTLFAFTLVTFFWRNPSFSFRLFRINLLYHSFFTSLLFIVVSTSVFQKINLIEYVALFTILSAPSLITGTHYVFRLLFPRKRWNKRRGTS